jgi:hypothetical protein
MVAGHSPVAFKSHIPAATTTTAFTMFLIVDLIGM